MKIINTRILAFTGIMIASLWCGCKKLVDVDSPTTSTNADVVYSNDATATSVLTSIYSKMSDNTSLITGITSMSLFGGLYADEFTLFPAAQLDATYLSYYNNSINAALTGGWDYWNNIYPMVFVANSAIEGLTKSQTLSAPVKQQLLGEAKFIRAFCYLYLVNLYGDVPLALTTDYKVNALLPRRIKSEIYKQIITDLNEAELELSENFVDGSLVKVTTERTSPNKWAARALLARAYLYSKDYANAEIYASLVIANKALFDLTDVNGVFLMNSKEAIWQLQSVGTFVTNTWEGRVFGIPATGPVSRNPVYLSNDFMNSFTDGDLRKSQWTNSVEFAGQTYYWPCKYKVKATFVPVTEYSMVLRLAEQYLIRAEARINQGNKIADGIADLNIIRTRARATATAAVPSPLPPISISLVKADALLEVEKERRTELFTEWGHRWFDLRRMAGYANPSKTRAEEILSVKSGWQSTDLLFPIPAAEIRKNPSLQGNQNAGY